MKINNFKLLDPPVGALVAKFDLDFGPVLVRGMSVFAKDGRRWITEPSEKWTTRDGETRWHRHAIITDQFAMADLCCQVKELLGAPVTTTDQADDIPY